MTICLTMKTASARDVQHGFSRYLAKASRGEAVVITKHGKKMARLVPVADAEGTPLVWPDFEGRLRAIYGENWSATATGTDVVGEARGDR